MSKIMRIKIENFKCIQKLKFKPNFPVTLLVGKNGSGKTAILDCISRLLQCINRKKGKNIRIFKKIEVKNDQDFLVAKMEIGVNSDISKCGINYYFNPDNKKEILENTIKQDEILSVYYPVNRSVKKIYFEKDPSVDFLKTTNAFDSTDSNFNSFFNWFRHREDLEKEKSEGGFFKDNQLQAVRQAIENFTGLTDLRFVQSPMHMEIKKQGLSLWVENLSNGEKCLLAMVGDIARRLAILSGEKQDPLKFSGIVLIDEIELHLHPGLQRGFITKITKTFPNCQFIASTQSPMIISDVRPESVFILRQEKGNVTLEHPENSFGHTSDTILEEVLGISARPQEIEDKLHEIFVKIDEENLTQAKKDIELLGYLIGSEPELERANHLISFLENRRNR